jgi:hypothetical protein
VAERNTQVDFNLPPRAKPSRDSFRTSRQRVKAWISSLPLAHRGEAARLLCEVLSELNRLELSTAVRFRVMEAFRPPVRDVASSLERLYVGQRFPLPAKLHSVAILEQEFQRAMALGYKIVVDDLSRSRLYAPWRKRTLLTALHRAIRHSSRALLCAHQMYSGYPSNLWRDIHQLYLLASNLGIQERSVRDRENALVRATSIADAYKQVLLLALSSPYRLRQGDARKIFVALEQWAPKCTLARMSGTQAPNGLFAIQPEMDEEPKYLELEQGSSNRLEWILDTADLSKHLREQIALVSSTTEGNANADDFQLPLGMSQTLVQRLMVAWGMMATRSFPRQAADTRMELVLGISSVHHFARENVEVEATTEAEEDNDSYTVVPPGWMAVDRQPVSHETLPCRVLDESLGGLRLRWDGDARAQVGELIAFRDVCEDGNEAAWKLGVIRWMRTMNETELETGVQCLADLYEPVTVCVCTAQAKRGESLPALLVPAQGPTRPRPSLITPGFLKDFPTRLVLLQRDEERVVKLLRVVESTGAFAQFHFAESDTPPEAESLDRRSEDKKSVGKGTNGLGD